MTCEFSGKCWRNSYTRYILETECASVPDRMALLLAGYATAEMCDTSNRRASLYAETLPAPGIVETYCPAISGGDVSQCREYRKESRRLAGLEKARAARKDSGPRFPGGRRRVWIPRETRAIVAREAHWRCEYCGAQHGAYREDGERVRCVVDHYVPLALGGHESDRENLVFACSRCNRDKSTSIWERGCRMG